MKNKKCPIRSQCWDYKSGNCENCDLGDHITKLHKKIDRLKAKNKKLEAQSEWISVTELMPPALGKVLVYSPILGVYMTCYTAYSPRFAEASVTHWMPLPQPPEMKGGE